VRRHVTFYAMSNWLLKSKEMHLVKRGAWNLIVNWWVMYGSFSYRVNFLGLRALRFVLWCSQSWYGADCKYFERNCYLHLHGSTVPEDEVCAFVWNV
jgi:hypothetical protein